MIAAIVYWNSTYIADAMAHLRAKEDVDDALLSHTTPLWCMNRPAAASARRVDYQRIRTETGMPKLVIRLRTLHPIFASVRCLGRVRA